MDLYLAVVLSSVLAVSWCTEDLKFPLGFIFGAATAAYQIEGAWNVSDKGESNWDRYTHDVPTRIKDHSNGDVACDSYHNWERDIEMAEELGLHFYRFSISWPRLLPTGFPNYISEDGKNYYNNLIDGLLKKGIEPFITVYHWDLPQNIQELGGWTNPLIADWFADYARVVYTLFGDHVKLWVTINEPLLMCDVAYGTGTFAPGTFSRHIGAYLCTKFVMLAHAKAWRIYDEEFKPKYKGRMSIANHLAWIEADSKDDRDIAEMTLQNVVGKYSHPIYSKKGGWPPGVEEAIEKNSKKRGYPKSTFPAFTQAEVELVRGTYDFYALNHYTSRSVRKRNGEVDQPWMNSVHEDLGGIMLKPDDWPMSAVTWFYIYPEGIRRQLVWLKQQYGDLEFIITENGYATKKGLEDKDRVKYYRDYLKQVLLAIKDGVNVTGYTAWSLMDNFEWQDGYSIKFGLYEVNFTDPLRTRIPRQSARYYASIIKSHSLDVPSV